jgi:hypothetical protein
VPARPWRRTFRRLAKGLSAHPRLDNVLLGSAHLPLWLYRGPNRNGLTRFLPRLAIPSATTDVQRRAAPEGGDFVGKNTLTYQYKDETLQPKSCYCEERKAALAEVSRVNQRDRWAHQRGSQ